MSNVRCVCVQEEDAGGGGGQGEVAEPDHHSEFVCVCTKL